MPFHAPAAASANAPASPREYPAGEPYRRYRESDRGHIGRDVLIRGLYASMLRDQIERIAMVEAPLRVQLLTQRLREIHGVARAGVNIQANIDTALAMAIRRGTVELRESFVYLKGQAVTSYRYPADDVTRSVALVPPEEIERAILHIVEDQFGYPGPPCPTQLPRRWGSSAAARREQSSSPRRWTAWSSAAG